MASGIREKSYTIGRLAVRAADAESNVAVIVTHPWKILGGNMHNNVVCACCLYFQKMGITTVRFDFDGSIGRGLAQVDQLLAVAKNLTDGTFSTSDKKPTKLILVGYSYGSLIASSATAILKDSCLACISIAPPFSVAHWLLTFHHQHHMDQASKVENLPRLFLIGDNDNFTSESVFGEHVASRFPAETSTGAVLKGADHFFRYREKDVLDIIGEWLLTVFPSCSGDLRKLGDLQVWGSATMNANSRSERGSETHSD